MKKRLLIVEDEKSVAKQLRWGLAELYNITIASDTSKAKPLLASGAFPVVTLDLGLPPFPDTPQQGLALLEKFSSIAPYSRVIVITGNAENENAMKAISLGAVDFCSKPIDLTMLKVIIARVYKIYELEDAKRRLEQQRCQDGSLCEMIGLSPVMTDLFANVRHASKTDYPVLITGSTGTGKEVAAKAVHSLGNRESNPLVIVNCGAIPENLLESELFGHEKGAFTDAASRQIGKFEQADTGTVFLDEIGELPILMQVKLLRVLQESTIERLGGHKTIALNVRIVAATNVDLEKAVAEGRFREDLYYRLNVIPIHIPDLKERPDDILLLAHKFLLVESRKQNRGQMSFTPEALSALQCHNWPGNVRELQNRIRRALGTTADKIINHADLGFADSSSDQEDIKITPLKKAREEAEIKAVHRALALSNNNISQAAKLLEVSRPTLHDLLKKHSITLLK